MLSSWRTTLLPGLVALALLGPAAADALAQGKKDNSKSIEFKTSDGVTLKGTLWPNSGGKRDAVVILLHHFDPDKGGNRSQDNWPLLAKMLHDDGYSVLSFDFRGFGESKDVNKDFWIHSHNRAPLLKNIGGKQPPNFIEYKKNFNSGYYQYLVNDIAAAKAYLDRRNDAKELNTSNVILIGAGQGATLGAMWVANECRRFKDKNPNPDIRFPQLAQLSSEPESKDIACCVWLTIDQSIVKKAVGRPLREWLIDAGKNRKVPQLFVFGRGDTAHDKYARDLVKDIKGSDKELLVSVRSIDGSKLKGSKLIDKDTNTLILKDLDTIMDGRGTKEHFERKAEAAAYWYVKSKNVRALNKKPGQEVPPVNLSVVLPQ